MAENSKIGWTTHTFNPWMGCTKVSEGCKNCYAEELMDKRYQKTKWGPQGLRVIKAESGWKEPLKWDRNAKASGERHRVFCASLADVFEGEDTMPTESIVPVNNARSRLFDLIEKTPNLDWLLLTKRPENADYILRTLCAHGLPNIWIGASVENQARADERIPHLIEVPAAVRFLSCEPLLGPVDLSKLIYCPQCGGSGYVGGGCNYETGESDPGEYCPVNCQGRAAIDWVIVGCESGKNAREMKVEWAEAISDQCLNAGVPFFMKQMMIDGKLEHEIEKFPKSLQIQQFPTSSIMSE